MKTQIHDGQRFESIETAVSRLVQESDTVQVDNRYLPQILEMAARHEITIIGDSDTKGYTTVSAFPETTPRFPLLQPDEIARAMRLPDRHQHEVIKPKHHNRYEHDLGRLQEGS